MQITVAEQVGVEGRGGYYDHAGAARDMLQNHMFQLFTLTAMEAPASLDAESIRDEKVKVLRSIPTPPLEFLQKNTVRAQYGGGFINGKAIPAYRQEEKVAQNSMTETFVAARFEIDNWRWHGVPFYLRTGKALAAAFTEINIVFKRPPSVLFSATASEDTQLRRNMLRLRIQPNEGISLRFNAKIPGKSESEPVDMAFSYRSGFDQYLPEAYERLIVDAMVGESTLFTRSDEVEEAWRLVDAVKASWAKQGRARPPALRLRFDGAGRVRPAAREGPALLDPSQRTRHVKLRWLAFALVLALAASSAPARAQQKMPVPVEDDPTAPPDLRGQKAAPAASAAPAPEVDGPSSPYSEAMVAYKAGNYQQAYDALKGIDPGTQDDNFIILEARILTELKHYDDAKKLLQPIDTDPKYGTQAVIALGDLEIRRHDYSRAGKYYATAHQARPADPDIILRQVYAAIGENDLVAAGKLASDLAPFDVKNQYDDHASYYFARAALAHATGKGTDEEDAIQSARTNYGITVTNRYLGFYLRFFADLDKRSPADITPPPRARPQQ